MWDIQSMILARVSHGQSERSLKQHVVDLYELNFQLLLAQTNLSFSAKHVDHGEPRFLTPEPG